MADVGARATDRGYERSIYFRDPNGVRIELLVWLTPPPADVPQAQLIKRAQQIREARGAPFVEDRDVREAVAELREAGMVAEAPAATGGAGTHG